MKKSIGTIKTLAFLMILAASIFNNFSAKAVEDQWEVVTPENLTGTINSVTSFADYVYVGTSNGVYKSIDRGTTWTQMNTGLTNLNVASIAISWIYDTNASAYATTTNKEIYAATAAGVFKSSLDENSWAAANTGLTQTDIIDLKIDQFRARVNADASSLYAVASTTGSIFRSDDAGATWSLQNQGIAGEQIKAVVTEPTADFAGGNIFAITGSNKVYSSTMFSTDGLTDETWTEKFSTTTPLNAIAVSSPIPGIEYLATDEGVLRSDDAGNSWALKNSGLVDLRINSLAVDYLNSAIAYAAGTDGIYKSVDADGDGTWAKTNAGSINVKGVNTNPATSTLAYAFTDNALYRLTLTDSTIVPAANDIIVPATIDNLLGSEVSTSSVVLTWDAPGDDGTVGTAAAYDLRYATSTITETNWATSTQLVGEPTPAVAGTSQTMTVTGLQPGTQYYFAIKSSDEVPNISAISTFLGVMTLSVDEAAPTVPQNLAATPFSTTQINLAWSTSTDNVAVAGYKLFRGGVMIATTTGATYTDGNLSASTAYVYQVSAYDSVGNESLKSAVSTATTPAAAASPAAPSGGSGGFTPAATTCTDWTYSAWSACVNGVQTRTIQSSLPNSCTGGTPVLSQSCTVVATSTSATVATTTVAVTASASSSTVAQTVDNDKDGLSNDLEIALGTNPNSLDTDGDGNADLTELLNNYDPLRKVAKLVFNKIFAQANIGKIFLQVESKGQAWYVNPVDQKRYFLGRPEDAFQLMRRLGLGVKHDVIAKTKIYPARLIGRILIDVEDKGRAYYINPKTKQAEYLGRAADAFNVMRKAGVGISSNNLQKITVGGLK